MGRTYFEVTLNNFDALEVYFTVNDSNDGIGYIYEIQKDGTIVQPSEDTYPLTLSDSPIFATSVILVVEPWYGETQYELSVQITQDIVTPIVFLVIIIGLIAVVVIIIRKMRS